MLRIGSIRDAEMHWYQAHGIGRKELKIKRLLQARVTRTRKKKSFVVCLSNDGYAASLEPRKIYIALRDAAAERNGLLRLVDESGEDYLYSRERFAPLKLPRGLQRALAAAA